jgi:hypothetical protein
MGTAMRLRQGAMWVQAGEACASQVGLVCDADRRATRQTGSEEGDDGADNGADNS